MKILGKPTTCHICHALAPTETVKCKLDCDGLEQEFCAACEREYHTFCKHIGTPDGDAAFERLKRSRAALYKMGRGSGS